VHVQDILWKDMGSRKAHSEFASGAASLLVAADVMSLRVSPGIAGQIDLRAAFHTLKKAGWHKRLITPATIGFCAV
jgi:hypothetical protein